MHFKVPKNDVKYHWTNHVIRKMLFYGLTPDRIRRVMNAPRRSENGVAENTIAVMQPAGSKKNPSEIWAMYQKRGIKKIVITAWRYPGVSPVRDEIPIPREIISELRESGIIQ